MSIEQDVLDAIGETHIVAGVGDVDDATRVFLQSLPNTRVGLAMLSDKLTKQRAKKALLNKSNFGGSESKRKKFIEENVNEVWMNHLRYGIGEESGVLIEETWLSEDRCIEITGVNFQTLTELQVAAPSLVYVASVEDLEESDRAVHHNNRNDEMAKIWLDRRIPSNCSERSKEYRYFPADGEDGFVSREELQPSREQRTYQPDSFNGPEPRFF